MNLYFGGSKTKIISDNTVCVPSVILAPPVMQEASLLSSDNYILTDLNGVCLIASHCIGYMNALLSLDDYLLTDSNGIYLTFRRSE